MQNDLHEYPQFRKLSNNVMYYKIISQNEFEEIQKVGGRLLYHIVKAVQYPEKLRVQDMLIDDQNYIPISEKEWVNLEKRIKPH